MHSDVSAVNTANAKSKPTLEGHVLIHEGLYCGRLVLRHPLMIPCGASPIAEMRAEVLPDAQAMLACIVAELRQIASALRAIALEVLVRGTDVQFQRSRRGLKCSSLRYSQQLGQYLCPPAVIEAKALH